MLYRIAITIAVVLVFVFAMERKHEEPATTAPTSDEPAMKGLQVN